MRRVLLSFIAVFSLMPSQGAAFDDTLRVRGGVHPEFFRVVVEGSGDLIRSIDLGDRDGEKRELRISLSEGTDVALPAEDTWKAGPVRSVRVEADVLVFAVDPTAPIETRRLHDPDRYVFDFMVAVALPARLAPTDGKAPAQPENLPGTGQGAHISGDMPASPPKKTPARPILTPEQQAARIQGIRRIVLDPGHGGYDQGLPGEKDFSLKLARRMERALGTTGIRARLTRIDNSFVSIGQRMEQIRAFDPDVYLSLHGSHRSFRVYTGGEGSASRDALALRTRLHSGITATFGDDALGEATAPTALTMELPYPGALVEIPMDVVSQDDASVDTVAGMLLGVLGRSEKEEQAAQPRKGWW